MIDLIFLATQHEVHIEEPSPDDIYQMGTIARVRQMLKLPNGTIRVLVEGIYRAQIEEFEKTDPIYQVRVKESDTGGSGRSRYASADASCLDHFEQYLRLSKKISPETYSAVADIDEPGRLADVIASHLPSRWLTSSGFSKLSNQEGSGNPAGSDQ